MPDMEVVIELKGDLLPQLVVMSAIAKSGQARWIENHCILVRGAPDLTQEVDDWIEGLREHYTEIEKVVVRVVPRSTYAPLLKRSDEQIHA